LSGSPLQAARCATPYFSYTNSLPAMQKKITHNKKTQI
jgi:hypothetical protein